MKSSQRKVNMRPPDTTKSFVRKIWFAALIGFVAGVLGGTVYSFPRPWLLWHGSPCQRTWTGPVDRIRPAHSLLSLRSHHHRAHDHHVSYRGPKSVKRVATT